MISRQRAIWSQCHNCVASDKKSHWIKEVEKCYGISCDLYGLRPVRSESGKPVEAHNIPVMIKGWRSEVAARVGMSSSDTVESEAALKPAQTVLECKSKG
jgi:hypothetical protein